MFWFSINSPYICSLPSFVINLASLTCLLPFLSALFTVLYERLISLIPASSKVIVVLSDFRSLRSENLRSAGVILPSLWVSNSARASMPDFAYSPFSRRVLSPNNSRPLSIVPLPFLSHTKIASPELIQATFCAMPSLSISKFLPFSGFDKEIMPLKSRSKINGSTGGVLAGPAFAISLSGVVMG